MLSMYTTSIQLPSFHPHLPTQYFYATPNFQPRVDKYRGDHTLMSPSQYLYRFRTSGLILGGLLLLCTLIVFSTELGRLYAGSNNRGRNDTNGTKEYLMYPERQVDINGYYYNPKIENRWMWPWSTATLTFSLVFFTTALLGFISGQRETYSTILTFFICSLVSFFLTIFLIATYSTTIAGWKSIYGTNDPNLITDFTRIDRDLSIVCLSMSCILFVLFAISMILSGITIDICIPKKFSHENTEPDQSIVSYLPNLTH